MPKFYVTTTRECLVEYVHAVEAPDATEAGRLVDEEGEGEYLGCSVGESLGTGDDMIEVSATRPTIVHPEAPPQAAIVALLKDVLPWLEAAEDLSDDAANLRELRLLQARAQNLLWEIA